MTFSRLVLTIISLLAAATLPDSSSISDASSVTNSEAPFRFSLADPTSMLDSVSPVALEPLSEGDARVANLRAPFSTAQLEPAKPFSWPLESQWFAAKASAADCLTAAVYYEAALESVTGKRAVAQVVLNRVRHPAFPNSVCGVVMQGSERKTGCQFTFTCDGSLYRIPSRRGWEAARQIALGALSGVVEPSIGLATHYHADYVRPYWASSLDKVAVIGTHIFYRWPGAWGRRHAFDQTVALNADYEIHQTVQWQLAAMRLHDFDKLASGPEEFIPNYPPPEPEPTQRDRPDDLGLQKTPLLSDQPMTLQADRKRGTLLADEVAGSLVVD